MGKNKKELLAASKICSDLNLEHKTINLSNLNQLFKNSSLINPDQPIPEGHYEQENMKATVVPNRNMILLFFSTAGNLNRKRAR